MFSTSLELFIEIAPEIPDRLLGDALRLGQVINNLVGNAIKFTEQGEVHVRAELAERRADAVGVRIAVRDTGIGMAREQAAVLFQPFVQADASVTRRFGGTGLGLTISKRLVELMGGQIVLSSEPGRGSTFAFTVNLGLLPAASEDFAASAAARALRSRRVLVVDDQETSLLIMRSLLEGWGFQVATAVSGDDALAVFREASARGEAFELLLLDWKMPGLNGLETARAIGAACSRANGLRPPAIIMVTAYGRGELLKAIEASAQPAVDGLDVQAILTKPVSSSDLFNTLLRLEQGNPGGEALVSEVFGDFRVMLSAIRGAHVLLVEDNEINQQVAQEFLAKGGVEVSVANNGLEALECVRRTAFDAVLMDLHMPLMDGFEAARRIRALPDCSALPIIAMTAAAMPGDRQDSAAAGMNDHLAKPIDPRELAETLLRWLRPTPVDPHEMPSKPALPVGSDQDAAALERALPGFPVRSSLARMGGNVRLYRRLLRSFAERHADFAGRWRVLMQSGDRDGLYLEAHNLKGEAGNLGFAALCAAADSLQQNVRDADLGRLSALVDELSAQCAASLALLRGLAEESDGAGAGASPSGAGGDAPGRALDSGRLVSSLASLKQQLIAKNFGARALAEELKDMIVGTPLSDEFAELALAVDQLRYGDALGLLEEMLEHHGWGNHER